MRVSLLGTESRILSSVPVELLVDVDGKIVRAAINWATIERLVGDHSIGEARVREFIRQNRQALLLAIQSHLFSRGVPLDRQLVLTAKDFISVYPIY
jgi:hypothetical protein